jgi:hypothetical protein
MAEQGEGTPAIQGMVERVGGTLALQWRSTLEPRASSLRTIDEGAAVSDIEKLAAMLADDELTTTKLVDGTGVILDVDSLQVFTLNETGMFLVEALGEGVADRNGLVARMVESFEVENDVASDDVDAFIADLARFLLENRK